MPLQCFRQNPSLSLHCKIGKHRNEREKISICKTCPKISYSCCCKFFTSRLFHFISRKEPIKKKSKTQIATIVSFQIFMHIKQRCELVSDGGSQSLTIIWMSSVCDNNFHHQHISMSSTNQHNVKVQSDSCCCAYNEHEWIFDDGYNCNAWHSDIVGNQNSELFRMN